MKKTLLIIIIIIGCLFEGFAQSSYRSEKGHIIFSGTYDGEAILAESHNLNLFLDYSTKEFNGSLDLETIDSGIDSLDSLIDSLSPIRILFFGIVPDDDFISWEHLELAFNIPVTVLINENKTIESLNIRLNHFNNINNYACLLSGVMELDISEFNNQTPLFDNKLLVRFTQVLFRQD